MELQHLLQAARRILLTLDDRVREELKYGVAFYRRHGLVAYLTTVPRKPFVHIGLVEGARLSDPHGLLTGLDRKTVRHLRISTPADLEREGVRELLHEALLVDEQRRKNRPQR
ncbi:MAG TPA: DUF1801 domain-containing protein [bacterium]|nr:DUF1801 domain-containing protein [bacterium]